MKKSKPIFIHSMFRTGSTYIWNKFRRNIHYLCLYEPLHHILKDVTIDNIKFMLTSDFKAVHHPELDIYYLYEYLPFLKEGDVGIPFFKKEFSYNQFCLNEENPPFKKYIDFLTISSIDQIPVLKFNRSSFRIQWFKKYYPNAVHIFVVRDPREQWQSYLKLYERTHYLDFFLMDLLAVGTNADKKDFLPLSQKVPLFHYQNPSLEKELNFYAVVLQSYSQEERYFIFYYIWFYAFIKNTLHADLTININGVSNDPSYREAIYRSLQKWDIKDVNFEDAHLEGYPDLVLPLSTMHDIETNVQKLILLKLTSAQSNHFFQNISVWDEGYLHVDKNQVHHLRKKDLKLDVLTPEKRIEKLEKLSFLFAESYLKSDSMVNTLIHAVSEKGVVKAKQDALITQYMLEISQQQKQLHHILHGYTYRTGKTIVYPFKIARKLARYASKKFAPAYHHIFGTQSPCMVKSQGKINLADQLNYQYGRHRSGWSYAIHHLKELHNPNGVLLDAFLERTFCWNPKKIEPHLTPWIGFIHVPPKVPQWFHYEQSNQWIFQSEAWGRSASYCKGLFALSYYHKKFLESQLDIPIDVLYHPTEFPKNTWTWDKFVTNREKKILQIGWWLRMLHAIYRLPKTDYKKIFLNVEHASIPPLMQKEKDILLKSGLFQEKMYQTAETIHYLPDKEYDRYLCENIVLVYLYDASANNTVIECIARNTPLLVNPIEPVREYLGEDYPFYYTSFEEAAHKAMDLDLIYKTFRYLENHPIKMKLTGEYFRNSFVESRIYGTL